MLHRIWQITPIKKSSAGSEAADEWLKSCGDALKSYCWCQMYVDIREIKNTPITNRLRRNFCGVLCKNTQAFLSKKCKNLLLYCKGGYLPSSSAQLLKFLPFILLPTCNNWMRTKKPSYPERNLGFLLGEGWGGTAEIRENLIYSVEVLLGITSGVAVCILTAFCIWNLDI